METAHSRSQIAGANADVRVAVAGVGTRGKELIQSLSEIKGVRVVALCDVDSANLANAAAMLSGTVKTYSDLRKLLASSDVDAITVATPNHWHCLAGIWAMQAGKDVYLEKPASHNVWEGRQLVTAAKQYNRVVQVGSQSRSSEGLQEAIAWIRAGNLGKITALRGFCYKYRSSIGKVAAPPPPPATVNLDLWCGPSPLATPHRTRFHYDWHWFWATGNGDLGNNGVHQMDIARWVLGEKGLPRHTISVGGRLGYVDDGQTPNTLVVIHDYPSAPIIFEVRGLPAKALPSKAGVLEEGGADAAQARAGSMDEYRGVQTGIVVDCEGGRLTTPSPAGVNFQAQAYDSDGKLVKEFKGRDRHMDNINDIVRRLTDRQMANFIDVVRSRKLEELCCPVEEGHVSSALCHLGNLSHLLGREIAPGELREKVQGNAPLAEAFGRMAEHLARNNIDLAKTPLTLGAPLTIDITAERFVEENAEAANVLLTREYRAPFVVPEIA